MKYLFLVLLLLGITAKVSAQEMMLNGSFEDFDGNPDGDTVPSTINYAANWVNLKGSCDLIHPDVPVEMSGTPCFGVGCGRFGVSTSGWSEFMYGKTLPLTAGQLYEVSFWIRKDYPTDVLRKIGLVMTDYVPTTSITSATPLISHRVTTTQCVKLKACFTALSSATHYVTIGPFEGEGTSESLVYLVDSVSVMTIPPTTPIAAANATASQPIYCIGDQILLDGSGSANETSYEWKLFVNGAQEIYSSGVINGTAGPFDATNHLVWAQPGKCYRAELTVYGVCKDVSNVTFCFADPDIDFVFDGNPVCENTPVDLQVTGDNGWVYTWKQGNDSLSSGQGLKNLTVTPTMGNGIFTVTVTTPEGCTHTEAIHLNVNSHDNLPPWMDGINGTGEYTYYVSQGDAVFFNSVLSNDYSNEIITYSHPNNIPSNFTFLDPSSSGGIFSFSWATLINTPTGEYYFQLSANDNNACLADTGIFKFRIIVVCDQCKVCVGFEDRTPGGTPLPPETRAGRCIQAGFSQPVATGTADVLFQAGVEILGGPYFEAGPNYEAVIDPSTCITDCEDCCTDWNGFTYDEIPNPVILNFDDNDPTNDIFQLTDINHPFCAYGAHSFHLEIVRSNAAANPLNAMTGMEGTSCCVFESPAPENPIPHASIWWDGYWTNAQGDYVHAEPQSYTYQIELYGCNGAYSIMHGQLAIHTVLNLSQDSTVEEITQQEFVNSSLTAEQQEEVRAYEAERQRLDKAVNLFPNPTTDFVRISGIEPDKAYYQVFDEKGVMLSRKEKLINQSFSLTDYSKGTYYIRIYSGEVYAVRKVVKM